jgi:hypothetical protein
VVSLVLCAPNDGLSGGNDTAATVYSLASLDCVDNEISTLRRGAGNTKPLVSSLQIAEPHEVKKETRCSKHEGPFGRPRRKWENIKLILKLYLLVFVVAARSNALNVFSRSNTGILGSNPTESFMSVRVFLCLCYPV